MKYNKHHIKKIVESLQNGDGRVRACQKANINYQTFLNWLNEHLEFLEAVKKAEDAGNDKIKDICKRRIIEDKSWQSAAWWLERNFPEHYRARTESTLNGGINIQVVTENPELDKKINSLDQ